MTDNSRRLLDNLDRYLNDVIFDLVDENETLEGQVNELREQVARLTERASENPNKGEWIESKERSKHWYCSVCGGIHTDPETGKWRETFDYRYSFCPNCGADMRGK